MGLMIVTTPSALARRIVDLICSHKQRPLETCCCKEAEYVFVKRGKPGNLGKQYDGPFKVQKKMGNER